MARNVIARKQGSWKVIALHPDVCKTPMGGGEPPVPYPAYCELDQGVSVAERVRANGHPVVVFDSSNVPKTRGDEPGTGGGVKSGTVSGRCWPLEHSLSVRAQGKWIVRHGDRFWLNGP